MSVEFHFLTGENSGAVVSLPAGQYSLGTTAACDLQINDSGEPCVLILTIEEENTLYVKVEEGKAYLDGESIGSEFVPFMAQQVVKFRQNCLTWCPKGSPLRSFSQEELNFVPAVATASAPTSERPSVDKEPTTEEEQVNDTVVANSEGTANEIELQKKEKQRHSGAWFFSFVVGILILCLLLSALVAGTWIFSQEKEEDIALRHAQEFLVTHDFDSMISAKIEDNMLVYSGIVPSDEVIQRFLRQIPDVPISTVLKISHQDAVLKTIEHSALLHGATVHAAFDNKHPKAILLYGYSKDAYVEKKLIIQLRNDLRTLPPLILEPHFTYEPQLSSFIQEQQETLQLPLRFSYQPFTIQYNGKLTLHESNKLQHLVKSITQYINGPIALYDSKNSNKSSISTLQTSDLNASKIGLSKRDKDQAYQDLNADNIFSVATIAGVTVQPLRFISLRSGERFFEGTVLKNGFTLQKIELDKLTFTKDQQSFTIYLQ